LKLARTKEWRESHGLTQRGLAAEAGVGEVTVARIETGASVTPSTARKIAGALGVAVADLLERPPVPLAKAPKVGRPSVIDVALDSARRQIALEKQAMFGGRSEPIPNLDQHHVNEAMQRLREEYGLEGNDAEAVVDFVLKAARLEEENATLRDRLQEREQAHS
jgi:transcriptional regulator with XRE-family HTH domain